jgi:hypothetical protein
LSSRPSLTPTLRSFGSTRRPRRSNLKARQVPHGTSPAQAEAPTCRCGEPTLDGSKFSSTNRTIS